MGRGQDTCTARASLDGIPANETKETSRRDLILGRSHECPARIGGVFTKRGSQRAFYDVWLCSWALLE
jgi:hypothetical protein